MVRKVGVVLVVAGAAIASKDRMHTTRLDAQARILGPTQTGIRPSHFVIRWECG